YHPVFGRGGAHPPAPATRANPRPSRVRPLPGHAVPRRLPRTMAVATIPVPARLRDRAGRCPTIAPRAGSARRLELTQELPVAEVARLPGLSPRKSGDFRYRQRNTSLTLRRSGTNGPRRAATRARSAAAESAGLRGAGLPLPAVPR